MLPLRMLGFLMLMLSLCDADSTCPTEPDLLILDPAEIIEEYGFSTVVNCTSTNEDHEGMYWRVEDEDFDIEEDWPFISQNVSLSEWNMRAQCKIKLQDSRECSKDLEVTVYRNPEVIYSVKHINAKGEGTQYEMQCDVFNVAPVQYLRVRFYRNNETIETLSFNETTKTPVNKSSTHTFNTSRGQNVLQTRCEAQLDFGPRGVKRPVVSQTHNLSAHYPPELEFEFYSEIFYKPEGNTTLSCEAMGNPPPVFHWTCDGVNMQENTNELSISPGKFDANCSCTAVNYLGSITKRIYVLVKKEPVRGAPAATPTPEASAPRGCPLTVTPSEVVVRFGDAASANCTTSATDAAGMGWEAPIGGTGFESPPNVTWMVEAVKDWSVEPSCYITLRDGDQCTVPLTVTVYKTPDSVLISELDHGPMVENTEYRLKCDINNVAPAKELKVKWYRDNETVYEEILRDTHVTPVNLSSTLSITPKRDHNGSLFTCVAQLHLGSSGQEFLPPAMSAAPYTAVVQYKPFIKACPSHYRVQEGQFNMNVLPCQTDGNPPPTVQWYHEGKLINSNELLNRNDSGKYMAEVVNSLGRSNTSVDITVEFGPSFTCDERYEVEIKKIQTTCEPEGLPRPLLTWFKDGKEIVSWTKHDSGEYLLKADNKHGKAEHKLHLDILYAPEFKEGNVLKEVMEGENVTFDCDAEGNPPPEVQWKFSSVTVDETTVWRQKIITVTAATSTSVYSCVATNKVGNVTKSFTLVIKGKSREIPYGLIWGCLIVLAIIIILVLMIFFHSRQKKQGEYNFIPDSNISLTTRTAASVDA